MKWLVALCGFVVAQGVAGEDQQVNLCGRELARARVLLCFGSEYLFKRSPNDIPDTSSSREDAEDQLKLGDWVWGGRRDALAAGWVRLKRGLVDECCLKSCSTEVIRMYC